jgi:hypothetical protein
MPNPKYAKLAKERVKHLSVFYKLSKLNTAVRPLNTLLGLENVNVNTGVGC